jgi:hypothetical protein
VQRWARRLLIPAQFCQVSRSSVRHFLFRLTSRIVSRLADFAFAGRVIAAAIDVGGFFHRFTRFAAVLLGRDAGAHGMLTFLSFASH